MSTLNMVRKTFSGETPPTGVAVDAYSSRDYRGANGMWFFANDGTRHHFTYGGHDSSLKAYQKCPPITAIINKKAQAFINGKTFILNSKGKEATGTEAQKLRKLLDRPNPLQSWKQFEAQGYIYQQLFGFNMVLPIKPVGFEDNIDAIALWNIPPFMLDIKETNRLFYQSDVNGIISSITLDYKGTKTVLQAKDVYIMKDFTPSFDSLIIPESRICSLEMPINNIIGAYESRNVLINYRGALGVLSNDPGSGKYGALPMEPDDKEALQNDFKRYGLKKRQWQVIITSASVKWQQMGYATKDLMLFEEIEGSTMAICDNYNYPYKLLANDRGNSLGGTEKNYFMRMLYQDGIIPEAESMYEQWNQFFSLSDRNLCMNKDFSHLQVLQEDKVQEATARKTLNEALKLEFDAGLITLNDWLVKLGEDPLPAELGNVRATDPKNSNIPLAVTIGVGGVQGLIGVLTSSMSEEAKAATLEIIFGISNADALRMAAGNTETQTQPNANNNAEAGNN
jgi:hypothetical protein